MAAQSELSSGGFLPHGILDGRLRPSCSAPCSFLTVLRQRFTKVPSRRRDASTSPGVFVRAAPLGFYIQYFEDARTGAALVPSAAAAATPTALFVDAHHRCYRLRLFILNGKSPSSTVKWMDPQLRSRHRLSRSGA